MFHRISGEVQQLPFSAMNWLLLILRIEFLQIAFFLLITILGADKVIRVWHPLIFTRPTGKAEMPLE